MADSWSVPAHWSELEEQLWHDIIDARPMISGDEKAEMLFHAGYFSDGLTPGEYDAVKDALSEYLQEEYGFEWDDYFDWEAWREWYDAS